MKKAKGMLMGVVVLAVTGGGLAYNMKSKSPIYICYTTDLSGDSHSCNVVYDPANTFMEPADSISVYYTITDDTVQCKKGVPCDSLTVLKTWDASVK